MSSTWPPGVFVHFGLHGSGQHHNQKLLCICPIWWRDIETDVRSGSQQTSVLASILDILDLLWLCRVPWMLSLRSHTHRAHYKCAPSTYLDSTAKWPTNGQCISIYVTASQGTAGMEILENFWEFVSTSQLQYLPINVNGFGLAKKKQRPSDTFCAGEFPVDQLANLANFSSNIGGRGKNANLPH